MKKIKEGSSSPREVKKELIKLDSSSLVTESRTHSSTSLAAEIAESTCCLKIWDLALDFGLQGISAMSISVQHNDPTCVWVSPLYLL